MSQPKQSPAGGRMSRPTAVVLLCEDNLTASFLRSYLKQQGISRGIRVNLTRCGSGFDWVFQQYPIEVNAYRQNKGRISSWLLVAVDADTSTVASRIERLYSSLKQSDNPRLREIRVQDEKIAHLVPRRNIETWLLALIGSQTNEVDDYKRSKNRDEWLDLANPAAIQLYTWTRRNAQLPPNCPESLLRAIPELIRMESPR